ncbi:hypothetical protein FVE85_2560 [Porphyridium purpureum]|uniref:DUF4219 domain-containing protein n=1 Tax=Porphyridium purpureum TaxID=35688 RepID=A0A5J4YKC7_PORPP|nr:hypothetical protein FVE85_2560 [Porphyridium purpureum]|eukprot:POR6402..scf291_13
MALTFGNTIPTVLSGMPVQQVMSPAFVLRADCANFPSWCVRVKLLLCEKEVWEVAVGGKTTGAAPGEAATAGASMSTSRDTAVDAVKDQKAKGLIGSMVDETLMHVVADSETAAEAWTKLEKMAKSAAPVYERELRKQLANFGQNTGKPVGNLLGIMAVLRRELRLLGVELSEAEYVQALFEALPVEFAATEQAWISGGGKASVDEQSLGALSI